MSKDMDYWILLQKQDQMLVLRKPVVKPGENLKNAEELIVPLEKREEILNELRQVLYKRKTLKYLSY